MKGERESGKPRGQRRGRQRRGKEKRGEWELGGEKEGGIKRGEHRAEDIPSDDLLVVEVGEVRLHNHRIMYDTELRYFLQFSLYILISVKKVTTNIQEQNIAFISGE